MLATSKIVFDINKEELCPKEGCFAYVHCSLPSLYSIECKQISTWVSSRMFVLFDAGFQVSITHVIPFPYLIHPSTSELAYTHKMYINTMGNYNCNNVENECVINFVTMFGESENPIATHPLASPSRVKSRNWSSSGFVLIPTKYSHSDCSHPFGKP